eukprot:585034-Pyramimonas_sp.AAC.1
MGQRAPGKLSTSPSAHPSRRSNSATAVGTSNKATSKVRLASMSQVKVASPPPLRSESARLGRGAGQP